MRWTTPALLGFALLAGGCGGGSSGGGDTHELSGEWHGSLEGVTLDGHGHATTMTLQINDDGELTAAYVEGIDTGVTAEPVDEESGIYEYVASTGNVFFLRREADSIIYVDITDEVGVLSHDATEIPAFTRSDAIGDLTGVEFVVDRSYNLLWSRGVQGSIWEVDGELQARAESVDGCEFIALMDLDDPAHGIYSGTFVSVSGGDNCAPVGDLRHYVSPNRDAALLVGCNTFAGVNVPQECGFITAEMR